MDTQEMIGLLKAAADPDASDDLMLENIGKVIQGLDWRGTVRLMSRKEDVIKRLVNGAGEVVASMSADGAKQTPTLVVEIKGGLVESIYATEPIRCIVLDYDTDFVTQDDLTVTDEDGRLAYPRIYRVGAAQAAVDAAEDLVKGVADED